MKRLSPGFTLIELVITMIIGAMFFLSVTVLLFKTQEGWDRALTHATLQQDYRASRQRMEYDIRSSSGPYDVTTEPTQLEFDASDGSRKQYWYDANTRQVKEAHVDPVFCTRSDVMVLFDDVLSWSVHVESNTVSFDMVRSTTSYSQVVQKHDTFSITSRVLTDK